MITLQFGQCGNQVGQSLFSTLSSDIDSAKVGVGNEANQRYTEETFDKWFGSVTEEKNVLQRTARAILIDTEHKGMRKVCTEMNKSWSYERDKIICRQSGEGAANNYALGYALREAQFDETILNIVARELDKLDRSEGFVFLLSAAGGTGSGVGSRILETLRDEYPTKPFLTAIVLPYTFGEVSTQYYNATFALSHFNDAADGIILLENEEIHYACANFLGKRQEDVCLLEVNRAISKKLAGLLQPIDEPSRQTLNSLLTLITPHPSYKFPTIIETPISDNDLLAFSLKHTQQSTTNILMTRGSANQSKDLQVCQKLQKSQRCADWSISSDRFALLYQQRRINNLEKYRVLVTNNSQVCRPLKTILGKAWNSYVHGAFLHRYREFGLEDDDFLRSFAKVENILQSYAELKGKDG